jgi:hypothetical protein
MVKMAVGQSQARLYLRFLSLSDNFCLYIQVKFVIVIILAILIFFFFVQPRSFKFSVKEAKLTEFNYNNNTLHYNLVLNFTAHNPNKKLGVIYDKMEGHVSYEGVRFASMDIKVSFRQDAKKTDYTDHIYKWCFL